MADDVSGDALGRFDKKIDKQWRGGAFSPSIDSDAGSIVSGRTELYILADRFVRYLIFAGFGLTAVSMLGHYFLDAKMKDTLSDSWNIVLPTISIIIGYVFGKEKK